VITLQFSLEISLDVAEQEVQAVDQCVGKLPADGPAEPAGLQQGQPADTPILTLALTSQTLPLTKLEDLADTADRAEDFAAPRCGPRQHQRRPSRPAIRIR